MNRLRNLREDNDLLQKDIAKVINVSQRGYSHYETENTDIPTGVLKTLAIYYNTSIDYILGLTDIKDAYPRSKLAKGKSK